MDYSDDSDLSDDGQNNTLKRPRSSTSPHSRLYSKLREKHIAEQRGEDSDLSSQEDDDSEDVAATPKLDDQEEMFLDG